MFNFHYQLKRQKVSLDNFEKASTLNSRLRLTTNLRKLSCKLSLLNLLQTSISEMSYSMCVLLLLLQASMITSNFTRENMVNKGMYFPVTFTTEQPPSYFCYHFRKICYGKFYNRMIILYYFSHAFGLCYLCSLIKG